jgi:hypothetical protein
MRREPASKVPGNAKNMLHSSRLPDDMGHYMRLPANKLIRSTCHGAEHDDLFLNEPGRIWLRSAMWAAISAMFACVPALFLLKLQGPHRPEIALILPWVATVAVNLIIPILFTFAFLLATILFVWPARRLPPPPADLEAAETT